MEKLYKIMQKKGFSSLLASLLSVAAGLIAGLLLLFCFRSENAADGFVKLVTAGFSSTDKLAKALYQAAPLVMTGLSVGFAFRAGLFNIGAAGQYTVGAFCALAAGIRFQMPWYLCLLAAMGGGAVWGAVPGLCKAFFQVNEVISSILLNWIGLFGVNLAISNMPVMTAKYWGAANSDRTASLAAANPGAMVPKAGLDTLFHSNYMNISILLVVAAALGLYLVLEKTTFGYELKVCGYNQEAGRYAGIRTGRKIVASMVIAGALSGFGGGIYYLSGTAQYTLVKTLLNMGFNGIPAALLANANPVGTVFSALFLSYIQVGGEAMQPEFTREVVDIIIAVILYLSAFSLLLRAGVGKIVSRRRREER